MGSPPSAGKGISAIKIGVFCIAAYLAGIALSSYILPIDFISSKLYAPNTPKDVHTTTTTTNSADPPTPASPPIKLPAKNIPSVKKKTTNGEIDTNNYNKASAIHESMYKSIINFNEQGDPFKDVDIFIHRNGEAYPCSRQDSALADNQKDPLSHVSKALINAAGMTMTTLAKQEVVNTGTKSLDTYDKYDFDAIVTHMLAGGISEQSILENKGSSCGPTWDKKNHYLDKAPHLKNTNIPTAIYKYCDMGLDRTPIQLDHDKLVTIPEIKTLPCHFHTREGLRITSLEQLSNLAREAKVSTVGECTEEERNADGACNDVSAASSGEQRKELHLYAVQAGRVFMFAPKFVGETFELPHVTVPQNLPVWLEVISLSPRVFDVFNFFDRKESAAIVDKALKETSETHRIKRSSTGANGYNVNSQRTSENGFDTHGKEAQQVKRRCMDILGFDEYEESLTDGLQVLRYNETTAYVPHLDWIDDYGKRQEHNFDTEHLGSNRFATILLYMTDLNEGDGGETVFTKGWPPGQAEEDHVQFDEAKMALRESGDVEGLLKPDSWEEHMVARCRTRLAIRPHSSRAVLFYSQNPDGTPDPQSMHGGCPVIKGEKWAANLWVWNAPRGGFPGSPKNMKLVEKNRAAGKSPENDLQKKASFSNSQKDETTRNAKLYFQDTFWGNLGFGDPPLNVNTYEGHQWNVKVDEKTVKTFVIDKRALQPYAI